MFHVIHCPHRNRIRTHITLELATALSLFLLRGYSIGSAIVTALAHNTDSSSKAQGLQQSAINNACSEFSPTALGTGWSRADCRYVWTSWANSLPNRALENYGHWYRKIFNEMATSPRRKRSWCLVSSGHYTDGVGSSTLRHLVTWILAEELHCGWVWPERPDRRSLANGATLYCHSKTPGVNHEINRGALKAYPEDTPCLLTNWVKYFRFNKHGGSINAGGYTRIKPVRHICIS